MTSKPKTPPSTTLRYKSEQEREEFHRAAELEGFSTTAAWMMFHLRRHARETLEANREDSK